MFGSLAILMIISGFTIIHFTSCVTVQALNCPENTTVEAFLEQPTELAENYFQYTPETYTQSLGSGKKVVLYFWAPWCTTCASLDFDLIDKKVTLAENPILLRVDYDKESELKKQYGVVTQHTFVQVDSKENVLALWIGGSIENFSKFMR